jgi:hypothetical protein
MCLLPKLIQLGGVGSRSLKNSPNVAALCIGLLFLTPPKNATPPRR